MQQSSRSQQRRDWVSRNWDGEFQLAPASADASFRSYWRITGENRQLILMDAPPDREDCRPFVSVARRLRDAGLHAPEILVADLDQGFLLLEDLGSRLYSDALVEASRDKVETLYQDALSALAHIQRIDPRGLPPYDNALLDQEMELFPQWLLQRHLRRPLSSGEQIEWNLLKRELIASALDQPRVFVHRDYHCRNLMVVSRHNPGIMDFQDAMHGPVAYDLVSLLRDCYVTWPQDRVSVWCEQFRQQQQPDISAEQWQRWFDLMGFQRHLKAAGIFCRLNHRDGKDGYLKDIPRTLNYTRQVCRLYPQFSWFDELLDEVLPRLEPGSAPG